MRIQDILLAADNTHAGKFFYRKVCGFLITQVPEVVTFIAEIFHSDPHSVVNIFDQVWAPVVENLETPDFVAGILDIDPVIGDDRRMPKRGDIRIITDAEFPDQQANCDEIAVRKA